MILKSKSTNLQGELRIPLFDESQVDESQKTRETATFLASHILVHNPKKP